MADYTNDIEKYLKGELTPAERHALEKKALDDPFLADALEGAEQLEGSVFAHDVDELQKKVIGSTSTTNWRWPLRIAASLAIILSSTYIIWKAVDNQPDQSPLALKQQEALQPQVDSITNQITPTEESSAAEGLELTTETKPSIQPQQKLAIKSEEILAREEAIAKTGGNEVVYETKDEVEKETPPVVALQDVEKAEGEVGKIEEKAVAKRSAVVTSDSKKEKIISPAAAEGVSYKNDASIKIIKGTVTSVEDGSPLPGVNVIIKGSTIGAITDEKGTYQISATDTNPVLVFSFIGLESTEVKVINQPSVDVALKQDASELSEVVVTGYGYNIDVQPNPPTIDLAHPQIGFKAFKQYLQQNLRYPEEARANKTQGRVTVEFTVEANGSLTDFNISKGIGNGCDEELIRLIKEGPPWIPTKKDGTPIQDKAKVRLKFELPK